LRRWFPSHDLVGGVVFVCHVGVPFGLVCKRGLCRRFFRLAGA
jgi:hypothetical protein